MKKIVILIIILSAIISSCTKEEPYNRFDSTPIDNYTDTTDYVVFNTVSDSIYSIVIYTYVSVYKTPYDREFPINDYLCTDTSLVYYTVFVDSIQSNTIHKIQLYDKLTEQGYVYNCEISFGTDMPDAVLLSVYYDNKLTVETNYNELLYEHSIYDSYMYYLGKNRISIKKW